MTYLAPLLRDPLVHFSVLGLVVFALSRAFEGGGSSSMGPVPERLETESQRERWLDEEVLVRKAREIGLDEIDLVVRQRLAERMRFLIEDANPIAEPDEDTLRRWMETHPETSGDREKAFAEYLRLEREAANRAAIDRLRGAYGLPPRPPESLP